MNLYSVLVFLEQATIFGMAVIRQYSTRQQLVDAGGQASFQLECTCTMILCGQLFIHSSKVSTRYIFLIQPIESAVYLYVHHTMGKEKRWRGEDKEPTTLGKEKRVTRLQTRKRERLWEWCYSTRCIISNITSGTLYMFYHCIYPL